MTHKFQSESALYSLPKCQANPCLKQAPYLKFQWQQQDSNPQPLGSYMHRTDKYSQHRSIIWLVWLEGWVFIYKLSGCGFESCCCHLNFTYGTCFHQGVPWHSGFTLKLVGDMIITILSNAPYRYILTKQLNHLANFLGLRGSPIFSCGYFAGPQFFLESISWVPNFLMWVFRGIKFFACGQFSNFLLFAAWEKVALKHIDLYLKFTVPLYILV